MVSGQGAEEDAGDALQERQRDEDDDRRQRRADQGPEDFADGLLDGLAAGPGRSARLVWMASTTTMASSMTRPMAAAMPPSVIRLKLMPGQLHRQRW